MIQFVRSGVKQCIVRTVDTDVVVSLIAYCQPAEIFESVVFACLSSAVLNRFYISKIAKERGERKYRALPFIYVLRECDVVGKFWGRWTESQEEEALTTAFLELSEKSNPVTEEQIYVIEWFIGFMYMNDVETQVTQREW